MELPRRGMVREELLAHLEELKRGDADWHGGRTFSLVYHAGDDVDAVVRDAYATYLFENALNPFAFPSLRTLEQEVVDMTASLLHAPEGARGSLTSGGSESILMALKTARDRAVAERGVTEPEVVAPVSAHPAFDKAAHLLGVRMVHTPVGDDLRADVAAVREALTDRTVLVVGSAPGYPHGVLDPVPELAGAADERGVAFHTDACLGGFMLPFWERLGEDVPPFDFRVPGVTSITADVHKYGYTAKGASVLLHRDKAHARHQTYAYGDWPGGLYGTRGVAGARGGGPIAAAWAVMRYLGEDGYLRLARTVRDTTRTLLDGIAAIDGLRVLGEPDMSVFAFTATGDVFGIGDAMQDRGWRLDRNQRPDALHMMVSPVHAGVADAFLSDLADAVAERRASSDGTARYAD